MVRLCIFDLDGTLTDTLDSMSYTTNAMMKELGYHPISKEHCRAYVGNGARVLVEKALREAGVEDEAATDAALEVFRKYFKQYSTYHVEAYDGIKELLPELKKEGIHLAVLSNKLHEEAVTVVDTIFGKDAFEWVQGQQEGIPRKPDPQAAIYIADALGISPEETVYIGDSEVDIKTGKNAGMEVLSVTWGFRSREELAEAGAEHFIDKPREILEAVRQQGGK